jgi:hypothetical protein
MRTGPTRSTCPARRSPSRLLPELVVGRDPAADPPGPPRRRRREQCRPTSGPAGGAPCTPTRQRALPLDELADLDAVYGYSFIVTNLEVTSGDRAEEVEHWYRHRTELENLFRDAKHGAALRYLPSGHPEVNGRGCGARC